MKLRVPFSLIIVITFFITIKPAAAQENSLKDVQITKENVDDVIDRLEADGFAGVIYLKLNQIDITERAFGKANTELDIDNSLQTIFDIGSRPIDFTKAAILLLDQRGEISMSDPITNWFDDVPADKQEIRIHHLMSGRSGLPDFFHTPDDWDPDLAWVDRETAIERILEQPLRFDPGEDQHHSHAAFVLLAALIESISEMTYVDFLTENFFDPAGMTRTGEYGDSGKFTVHDFAEGEGPQKIGLPNIPPNWGPTSWLIRGSGGMYSTLDDLKKFYRFIRSVDVLDTAHNQTLKNPTVNIDGTDRGFELFNAFQPEGSETYLFLNKLPDRDIARQVFCELEELVFALDF